MVRCDSREEGESRDVHTAGNTGFGVGVDHDVMERSSDGGFLAGTETIKCHSVQGAIFILEKTGGIWEGFNQLI